MTHTLQTTNETLPNTCNTKVDEFKYINNHFGICYCQVVNYSQTYHVLLWNWLNLRVPKWGAVIFPLLIYAVVLFFILQGHVTSYYGIDMQKYTSFQVHMSEEVRQMVTLDRGLLSLTKSTLACNLRSGIPVFSYRYTVQFGLIIGPLGFSEVLSYILACNLWHTSLQLLYN